MKPKPESIQPTNNGSYAIYGTITHPTNSVLSGQTQEVPIKFFDTLEDATKEHPDLPVCNSHNETRPVMPQNPPENFDYYDAGEYWHENDY